MDEAIAVFATLVREHPFLPSVMLRELAEQGAHLDPETLTTLARVPRAFAVIVAEGIAAGVFREVDPVAAYFTIVAPILFFRRRHLSVVNSAPCT